MNEFTQEWQRKFQHCNINTLNNAFFDACENGHLDVVKYLLTSPDLKKHADIYDNDHYGFRLACLNGHLEVVKYLLISPDLKGHANIHILNNDPLANACKGGHLAVVEYLLTSPDLKEHAKIHAMGDLGFRYACYNGHFDIVRYLLTSPDLQDHADIRAGNYCGFKSACQHGHLEIVKFLLSLNNEKAIDFQETQYNLDWAIKNKYFDIVFSMMRHLYQHDIDVFNARTKTVMNCFTNESIEHAIAMITEFDFSHDQESTTEFNLIM